MARRGGALKYLIVVVAVVFSGGVLSFAGVVGRGIWEQHDATQRFVATPATVVVSTIQSSRKRKGKTSYKAVVLVEYIVDGRTYRGDRTSYGVRFDSSRFATAEATVKANPVGSTVTVHVDPLDPQRMVRRIGVDGSDYFPLLPLTIFIGGALLLWAVAVPLLRRASPVAGGLLASDDRRVAVVRLSSHTPLMAAALATIAAGVAATVAAALLLPPRPPESLVLGAVVGVVLCGCAGFWWSAIRRAGRRDDLVIDREFRIVRLPRRLAKRHGEELPFADVADVQVFQRTIQGKHGPTEVFDSFLRRRGDGGEGADSGMLLRTFSDEESARDLAEWIRTQVGVKDSD